MTENYSIYYCYPVFRPPSEGNSLLIQLTEGCTFQCDFCVSNLRKDFKIRNLDDVKKDLDLASRKCSTHIRKIFFLDGNAMVTPTEKLLEITKYAMNKFPNAQRVGVYAHAKDILKKSDDQLKDLSDAGLKIAYVGFESGDDSLLKEIQKNATKEDFINAARKLMNANITLSATFINGLGGSDNLDLSKNHAMESADLVNKICPDDDRLWYISFLSLMIPQGTVLYEKKRNNKFIEMNAIDILKELKTFIEQIKFSNKGANCVFRSNHASNYLPIKGILEKDKAEILDLLKYGISNKDVLRSESYRGL
ncbi:MAG: radical SAM protein [Candidatus Lokiarchaeota archaeon]|nr:radical SAM protein [Candidatus Lokiarchaeota archaeon]